MQTFRTPEGEAVYQERLKEGILSGGCKLCSKESIKSFTYWKIVTNDFPYDRIAKVHDMILSIRHATEDELTSEEQKELLELKYSYIKDNYGYIIEGTHYRKTIPDHFHLHLINIKDA